MRKYLIIIMALGITFCILPTNAAQEKKSTPASSDSTGAQRNKSKKQGPKQKFERHKPTKEEMGPGKLDTLTLKRALYTPLLRLKDSSQNNSH